MPKKPLPPTQLVLLLTFIGTEETSQGRTRDDGIIIHTSSSSMTSLSLLFASSSTTKVYSLPS